MSLNYDDSLRNRVNNEIELLLTIAWYGRWGRAAILAYVPAIKVLSCFKLCASGQGVPNAAHAWRYDKLIDYKGNEI